MTMDLASVSAQLRAIKRLPMRPDGSLQGAIMSAGGCARKHGQPFYVWLGNSYGRGAWMVSYRRADAICLINNQSDAPVFEVAADLTVSKVPR